MTAQTDRRRFLAGASLAILGAAMQAQAGGLTLLGAGGGASIAGLSPTAFSAISTPTVQYHPNSQYGTGGYTSSAGR